MTITPIVAAIGAIGGYFVVTNMKDAGSAANQPATGNSMPDQSGFWQTGSQPQTANGIDHTASDWANVVGSLAKFGTSIAQYWGTSQKSGNDYGGGIGASSNQTTQYGNGSNPSDWGLPSTF